MGIVVERTSAVVTTGGSGFTAYFTGTPSVGNRIIGSCGWYSSYSNTEQPSLSDDATGGSNTYAIDKRQPSQMSGGSTYVQACIFSAPIVRTKSGIGVAGSGLYGYSSAVAIEVNGLASSPVDVAAGDNTSTDAPHRVTTGALAQADELVYCAWTINGDTTDPTYSHSWSSGSPIDLYIRPYATYNCEDAGAAYLITSSAASLDVGLTHASTSNKYDDLNTQAVVTYKAAQATPPHARSFSPDGMGMRTTLRM